MKSIYEFNRRRFVQAGVLTAASLAVSSAKTIAMEPHAASGKPSPIKLGLASYTFRNFSRAQLIPFMKQLNVTELNAKDVKDHLPADPQGEAAALADYAANGIKLHAVGAVYFRKNEDEDVRAQFEYAKRAGINVIVAGDPTPETLPRIEKFVREYDIRIAIHNHGPEDKVWPSPMDVLKAVKGMDPRMGCCIDVGHCVRAGTDVVEAVRAAGPRLFNMHMKDLTNLTKIAKWQWGMENCPSARFSRLSLLFDIQDSSILSMKCTQTIRCLESLPVLPTCAGCWPGWDI